MKKKYLEPETEYIDFDVEDIITDVQDLPTVGGETGYISKSEDGGDMEGDDF